jgi:hypothetical protein
LHRCDRREVCVDQRSTPAERFHLSGGFFGARAPDERDIRTRLRQRDRDPAADPGVRAGDDRDAAGEVERSRHHCSWQMSRTFMSV